MGNACIAIVAIAFVFVSIPSFADESGTKTPSKLPAQQAWDATDPNKGPPKTVQTAKDKKDAVDAAKRPLVAPGSQPGLPQAKKNWDEMTPAEKEARRKAWLFHTGDW